MVSNQHPVHSSGTVQSQPSPKQAVPVPVSLGRTKRLRPHFLPPNSEFSLQPRTTRSRQRLASSTSCCSSLHPSVTPLHDFLIAEASCSVNVAVVAVTLCATDNRLHRLTTPCPLRSASTSTLRPSFLRDCCHTHYACRPVTIDYTRYTQFTSTLSAL